MNGFEFLQHLRGVSQTEIATALGVSPQTVYKWGKKIRKIPEKYKETIGKLLNVHPKFLEQELTPQDIVYILSGTWVEGENSNSVGLQVIQEENDRLKKKVEELERKVVKIEEESGKLFVSSSLLEKHLYTIDDEAMRKIAKEVVKGIDRIQNVAKGIDNLL